MPMIEIHRVRVDPADVPRLLALRGPAMSEFRARFRTCARPTSSASTATSGSTSAPG